MSCTVLVALTYLNYLSYILFLIFYSKQSLYGLVLAQVHMDNLCLEMDHLKVFS